MNKSRTLIILVTSTFLAGIFFTSCRKKDTTESTVKFNSPASGSKFNPSDQVQLSALVEDDEKILLVEWYIEAPNGDTALKSEGDNAYSSLVNGKSKSLDIIFRHGQDSYQNGIFSWRIIVSNKYKTKVFTRSFQVGDIADPLESKFAIATFDRFSSTVTLYDKNLQLTNSYEVPFFVGLYKAFQSRIYTTSNDDELISWDGFTGGDKKTHMNSAFSSLTLTSSDKMYVTEYSSLPHIASLGIYSGVETIYQNKFNEAYAFLRVGDILYTVEYDISDSRNKLVLYNVSSGTYISHVILPQGLQIYGLFNLGNRNRVYITVESSSGSYTSIWYFNKSQNALAKLSNGISGTPSGSNAIMINSNTAWIFTSNGLYEFSTGEQATEVILNGNSRTNDVESYAYNSKEKILMYEQNSTFYFYDTKAQSEIGTISTWNTPVFFLYQ